MVQLYLLLVLSALEFDLSCSTVLFVMVVYVCFFLLCLTCSLIFYFLIAGLKGIQHSNTFGRVYSVYVESYVGFYVDLYVDSSTTLEVTDSYPKNL